MALATRRIILVALGLVAAAGLTLSQDPPATPDAETAASDLKVLRDVGLPGDCVDGKACKAIAGHEQLAGRGEDAGSCLFGDRLALTKPVGSRAHIANLTSFGFNYVICPSN